MWDIKQFIEQANKTPLLKDYRQTYGKITKEILRGSNFVKKTYEMRDLMTLPKQLTGFVMPKISKQLQLEKAKDIYHLKLIEIYQNQELIKNWRKRLGISPRGFKGKAEFKKWAGQIADDSKHREGYKDITFAIRRIKSSGDINKIRPKKILKSGEKILHQEVLELALDGIKEEWNLPERYTGALRELILFNKAVPAESGVKLTVHNYAWGAKSSGEIVFDKDTTKEEIIKLLTGGSVFKNAKSKLRGGKSHRAMRKSEETSRMIEIYNKRRAEGATDKTIFNEIRNIYFHLSPSAVRKRIKGK